jgi:acetyl esterase/lipase
MASAQLQQLVQMLRARPIAEDPTLEERRAGFETMAAAFPLPEVSECRPVDANGVPAEWVTGPGADREGAVLYLHGGGYVIGSIATHRPLAARVSQATGLPALIIDYRLAPEHPFPAAVTDAVAAYRWLLGEGISPKRIVIAGDSAGGGLTLATLLSLRDSLDALPAAGVCISPWTDLECIGESMTSKADADPMVQKEPLVAWAGLYLNGADPRTPLAAPLYGDPTGLPPLLIQVGTSETLLDDATRFVERAKAAGVDVTFEPWEEMIHVWHLFAHVLPEGRQAIERIGEWVRTKIA